ncbi:hypothetical protein SCHPADRAFT_911682 [Schizopora paradoxa]|uniref:Secreted protein n=1 Tax=Schizopora paradoxa TaxID=27342 RepID=A0A0H2QZH6_9AGAM|nr:hypothetical protein SCHPADRAFT_911682 [Schizopora paradoxa]
MPRRVLLLLRFAGPLPLYALVQNPISLTAREMILQLKSLSYISRATQYIVSSTPALSETTIFGPVVWPFQLSVILDS